MRIAATAAVFGGVVLVALAGGQPPAKDKDAPAPKAVTLPAAKHIADLGSDDYRTRETAGKALAVLGDKALPEMRKALDTTDDPEVSRRLTVLVRKIDLDRLVSPKRVTLSMKDKPIQAYLDEIGKQTGYKIEFGGGPDGKHTFEFDNTPFWVAIDQIANAVGLVVYADGYDDSSIRMYNQDTLNPHVTYAGPFRFLATQIQSNKNVQLSGLSRRGNVNNNNFNGFNNGNGPQGVEQITLNFQIQSEPKNPILGTTQTEVLVATDDTGASLIPPKDAQNARSHYYGYNSYRTHNMYANLNLVRQDKSATAIKTLKAKTGVVMLSATVPEIVVADPLKVKNKKFVGRTAEIDFDSMTEANGQYTVTLTAKKLGASDEGNMDYNWGNMVHQKMEAFDEKGNKFRGNVNASNNNGAVVTVTMVFTADEGGGAGGMRGRRLGGPVAVPAAPPAGAAAKAAPPVKFVFNEWISVTHEVTFEFKNLPLP